MNAGPSESVTLRSVGIRIYLPALFYGTGQGAIAGIIALSALDLGADKAGAGMVVALYGIGGLLGDLPAGALAARFGERRAMLVAAGLMMGGLVLCVLAPWAWALAIGVLFIGFAGSVWMLARQAYIAESIPFELRARALSTLGGVNRIGMFIGPFLGAGAIKLIGLDGPYLLFVVILGVAILSIAMLPDPPGAEGRTNKTGSMRAVLRMTRESMPVLRTLGLGIVLVGAVRASRQAVIPLWGSHLGLDPASITLLFAASGAVDMLLFYPAGWLMDRKGRAWIAVPSMVVLGIAMLLTAISGSVGALALAAVVMGIGNGMGSGLVMTLGADLSPPGKRAEFLGAWRLCGDTGTSLGPLTLGALTAVITLGPAIAFIGCASFAGAWLLGHWIPRIAKT